MLFGFKRIKRRISARRGRMGRATLAQSPDAELTSTMNTETPRANQPIDSDRDDAQTDHDTPPATDWIARVTESTEWMGRIGGER